MRPEGLDFPPSFQDRRDPGDPHDSHDRLMRRLFLAVVTGGALVMVPWIAYLATVLPDRHRTAQWRIAWVGFDTALVSALLVTAVAAWMRRQIAVISALATATLLLCDAWFDIALDWGTGDVWASAATAAFCEVPLAVYLMLMVRLMMRRLIQLTVRATLVLAGDEGSARSLHELSVLGLVEPSAPITDPSSRPAEP